MATTTMRELFIKYADMVERGTSDTDLSPDERVYVTRLVHAAATAPWAAVCYPCTDGTRDGIVTAVHRAYSAGSIGVPLTHEAAYHAAIVRNV